MTQQKDNSGYTLIGMVLSGAILGWLIDKYTGTAPWGVIAFIFIGFVYGAYKAHKESQAYNTTQRDQTSNENTVNNTSGAPDKTSEHNNLKNH